MWFDGIRQPNTLYVASVSRGKDSTAMLRAIQLMGWPLDAICSVDIWFDDETPAELPPMVAFKDAWDAKCLEWFGIPVTRLCATKREREREKQNQTENVTHENLTRAISTVDERTGNSAERLSDFQCSADRGAKSSNMSKLTYTDIFYRKVSPQRERELRKGRNSSGNFQILGYPQIRGGWCQSDLKRSALTVSRTINAVGVPGNSSRQHQGLSVEERGVVSRPPQGKQPRQSFPTSARTRRRK